jgi:PAS domain S-box-containing protein
MLDQVRGVLENYLLYNKTVSMKNFNDNILESIDSGILSVDTDGMILSANKRVTAITGIRDPLIGRRIESVFPLSLFERNGFAGMVKEGRFPDPAGEHQYRRGSRLRILSFIISSLREESGRTIGAVITVFDMTEKRQMEEQVRRAESLAALGELSAGLAHEIKNPLTAIKGFAQLLPSRLGDGEFLKKFAEVITVQVSRLDDITERLLTFARPDLGEFSMIGVRELVQDALTLVRYQLEEAGLEFRLEVPAGEDIRVSGNPNRLSQVLLNIIINAVHAMQAGGRLVLRIGVAEQSLSGTPRRSVVRIDCIDTGAGIPREELRKVFNPFFTTKQSGTGLGLSISYRIVEEHGGTIELRSRPGKGTRVRIVLPRAR